MWALKYRIDQGNLAWINSSWSVYNEYIGAFSINSVIEKIWVKIFTAQTTWHVQPIKAVLEMVRIANNMTLKIPSWVGKPDMNDLLMHSLWWIWVCISDKWTNRGDLSEFVNEPERDVGVCIPCDFSSQSTPLRRFLRRTWFGDELCMQALWLGRCCRVCAGGGYCCGKSPSGD